MIVGLLHRFYDRVRQDLVIGPIFNAKITAWNPHLEPMVEFWSSGMMMSGTFHELPMEKHKHLTGIAGVHFLRWLDLFAMTADSPCLLWVKSRHPATLLQCPLIANSGHWDRHNLVSISARTPDQVNYLQAMTPTIVAPHGELVGRNEFR